MDNTEIVREWLDAFRQGDASAVDRLFDPKFVGRSSSDAKDVNRSALRKDLIDTSKAAPNSKITIRHMIAQDDYVACHYTMDLIDSGKAFGLPATGRRIQINGVDIYRFADGKIIEQWAYSDSCEEMLRQGVTPH